MSRSPKDSRRFHIAFELWLNEQEWTEFFGHPLDEERVKLWLATLLTLGALRHQVYFDHLIDMDRK